MIGFLIKLILFVAALVALTFGARFLAEQNAPIIINAFGWEIAPEPITIVLLLIGLMLALWLFSFALGLIIAVVRFITGDETALSRYFARNRINKGQRALSDGFLALAAGEGQLALSNARTAKKCLGSAPELTTLLAAQAYEAIGDTDSALRAYKELAQLPKTRFIGVRGLLKQKLAAGETEIARQLAQHAFTLKPGNMEIQNTLLKLQSEQGDWKGARETLRAQLKFKALPRDVYQRREAVLMLQQAKALSSDTPANDSTGDSIGAPSDAARNAARDMAIEANRLSLDLIPAAVMAAQALNDKGKKRAAVRVLKKAWEVLPHPDLAATFAALDPNETPEARLKRFDALIALHPNDPQSRMLLAELQIAAQDFPAARAALGDLATTHPAQRSLALMAAIERGSGADDAVVRGWLSKAVTASRGPQWCCDKCKAIHSNWQPTCDNCESFDTLAWRELPESLAPSTAEAALLPVIVTNLFEPPQEQVSKEEPALNEEAAKEEPRISPDS